MKRVLILGTCMWLALGHVAASEVPPQIAIIIDDLGYALDAGERAIALPGPVSYAILPGAPRAARLARAANASGKEILVHLPMQALVEPGATEPINVTLDMSREGFASVVDRAFESVPHAVGINNHRGSLITRHPGHMQWLMEEIRARGGLFFIDSFTTHESVAMQIAAETGVRARKRDVFLDTQAETGMIRREFERLKALARRHGAAIGIGHPHDVTLTFLETELPKLADEGFELVPVSALVAN